MVLAKAASWRGFDLANAAGGLTQDLMGQPKIVWKGQPGWCSRKGQSGEGSRVSTSDVRASSSKKIWLSQPRRGRMGQPGG